MAQAKQYVVFILLFLLLAPSPTQFLFMVVGWLLDLSGAPH